MKKIVWFYFLLISFSFRLNILPQEVEKSDLHQKLLTLSDISVNVIKCDSNFSEAFEIFLTQPVDHLNPNNGPKFKQRIYLRHRNFTKPMVMNNEGYATNSSRRTELAEILQCNEMFVEHRYFGESKPDSTLGWEYLTTAQSAADHKRVVDLFSKIYKGKWISTGISKGGQTSIFFKYYYPDAVDVWVPYVAPLNLEQEDKRIFDFLNKVGTKKCRDKIKAFQRAILKNRHSILPMLEKHMNENNYKFTMGLDKTLEYSVFEYSFAFWQWGNSSCDKIPDPSDSPDSLFKHLYTASSFKYFDSTKCSYYLPFYYQAYTEIGYYGYDVKEFSDLLVSVKDSVASSIFFAPKNVSLEFDSDLMLNVRDFITENGNNMLFIYGENDTWSASAVEVGQNTNALKMVKEGGSHRTRIHSFEGAEKEKIYSTLEKWLDVVIDR